MFPTTHWSRVLGEARRSQRGATALEYGVMVLILVSSLTVATQSFQEAESEKLDDAHGRIGTPVEQPNIPLPTASTVYNATTTTTTTGSVEASASMTGSATTQGSQKWTAVTEINVTTAAGAPLLDADVEGVWTLFYADGLIQTESANCSSDATGSCTLTLWNMRKVGQPNAVDYVVFTITALDSADATPAAGVVGSSITIASP